MKKYFHLSILLFASTLASCGQRTFDEKLKSLYKNTVPVIKSGELKTKLERVFLLDTRAPEEYKVSHIPGSRMINYAEFDVADVEDIPKDEEVIVYCSVGYRSERVGERLRKAGYKDVKNLYGGIFDWKNKGFEVVNLKNQPTDSVHTYNKSWGKWLRRGIKVN